MVSLLMDPCIRDTIETIVMSSGYTKTPRKILDQTTYRYVSEDGMLIVNLTSASEGKIQLQGDGIEELYEKGNVSKYYPKFAELVKKIGPNKIVNDGFEDIFPELLE